MFILSVKATKRHLIITAVCVAAVLAILIAAWCFPAERTMVAGAQRIDGHDDEMCAAYLRSLGYAVMLPAEEVREIRLPDQFNDALTEYNALQRQAGFDLSGYAGMRVKYRTFAVIDHPSGEEAAAHLYIYDDQIIGGDIAATSGEWTAPLCKAALLTQ